MKTHPLSNYEWTTLWVAVRYFCGRMTIASATFPKQVIEESYYRMTEEQRIAIAKQVYEVYQEDAPVSSLNEMDKRVWLKFAAALDTSRRQKYFLTDGSLCICFKANGRLYPLDKYLQSPHLEVYLPEENVDKGEE